MKRVKCNILAPATRSLRKTSFRKIMKAQARRKKSESRRSGEEEAGNQLTLPPLPIKTGNTESRVSGDGPTSYPSTVVDGKGTDKTCPLRGVILTQNIQELSGKDRRLESLLDPLVEIMISNGIMIYCIQETWVLGNSVTMVHGHIVFMHNMDKKE